MPVLVPASGSAAAPPAHSWIDSAAVIWAPPALPPTSKSLVVRASREFTIRGPVAAVGVKSMRPTFRKSSPSSPVSPVGTPPRSRIRSAPSAGSGPSGSS